MSANLIVGKDPSGNKVPVAVDESGQLKIVGGGGGGGSTDMTTANAQLTAINANTDGLEGKADTGNAILTTTAADVATLKDEAILIDAKLPSLSSGRVPVEANNAASQVYNYTATGAVAINTVLIGPIDCALIREVSVQIVSAGTSFFMLGQISNDGTNWISCPFVNQSGSIASNAVGTATIYNYQLLGAKNFRVIANAGATAGTTTLVAYASQQPTPKLYQSVTGQVNVGSGNITPGPTTSTGFSLYHTLISAASTNATNVKTSAGVIGTCVLTNTSTTFKYVKFFNLAAAPTMGTSTPVIQFPVAPNSTLYVGTAFAGFRLSTGISYAITNGSALLDNSAVGAGEVLVNLTYA